MKRTFTRIIQFALGEVEHVVRDRTGVELTAKDDVTSRGVQLLVVALNEDVST